MLILGVKMTEINFSTLFIKRQTYFVSVVKLVVYPAIGVGFLFVLKLLFTINTDMILVFFIAFAMPTAGLASTFSDQHNGDTENAVIFTLGSTILSVATIPVLYWLLCMIL